MIDIKRQVVASRFLAGLDNEYAAAVRNTLRLQGTDRRQAAENGVAIVGAAAAIELVAAQYRQPRTKTIRPAGHFRLLVEMAKQQHGILVASTRKRRHFDEDQRRASGDRKSTRLNSSH